MKDRFPRTKIRQNFPETFFRAALPYSTDRGADSGLVAEKIMEAKIDYPHQIGIDAWVHRADTKYEGNIKAGLSEIVQAADSYLRRPPVHVSVVVEYNDAHSTSPRFSRSEQPKSFMDASSTHSSEHVLAHGLRTKVARLTSTRACRVHDPGFHGPCGNLIDK